MQTIFRVTAEFQTEVLRCRRDFTFATRTEAEQFIEWLREDGGRRIGFRVDHILTPEEAIEEIARERAERLLAVHIEHR